MPRTDVTKKAVAGLVEQIITDGGATQLIDMKKTIGPIMEEYMRENQWLEVIDLSFGEDERVIPKINYKALRDSEVDFDPSTTAKGATVKPEEKRVTLQQTKEVAAEWYERDFEKSNGLETVSKRISAAIFKIPDSKIDIALSNHFKNEVEAATGTLAKMELDIDGMAATAENGKIVFEAIKKMIMALIKSGKTNDYVEGTKIPKEEIKVVISPEVEEIVTAYKASFIDQSGLINVGTFGTKLRNIEVKAITEMPEGLHVAGFTKRAVASTIIPSVHSKVIPEAINQDGYMSKVNNVYAYGFKTVFENEIIGIVQTAKAPAK